MKIWIYFMIVTSWLFGISFIIHEPSYWSVGLVMWVLITQGLVIGVAIYRGQKLEESSESCRLWCKANETLREEKKQLQADWDRAATHLNETAALMEKMVREKREADIDHRYEMEGLKHTVASRSREIDRLKRLTRMRHGHLLMEKT